MPKFSSGRFGGLIGVGDFIDGVCGYEAHDERGDDETVGGFFWRVGVGGCFVELFSNEIDELFESGLIAGFAALDVFEPIVPGRGLGVRFEVRCDFDIDVTDVSEPCGVFTA